MKAVIVGCGRVGAGLADELDRAGWQVLILDLTPAAFDRLPVDVRRHRAPRRRHRRGRPAPRRRRGRRPVPRPDRGRQPQRHGRPAGRRGARRPQDGRQDQRPGPRRGVRPPGHRHAVPDQPDVRGGAGLHWARRCRSSPGIYPPQQTARAPDRRDGSPASSPATSAARRPVHPGGLGHVRARRGRRQGRVLPDQGAHRVGPRGGPHGEGPPARRSQITDEIGSVVIAQDGCEGKYLHEAGANRADIVAAVTGDDEDNLVICQMAKHHFDVPRTIARVNNPKNERLFRHLGVDEIISPTRMILGSIEQDIPVHELLHLAALGVGELEIIEAHLQPGSPAIGKIALDIPVPAGCSLFGVIRDGTPTPLNGRHGPGRGRQGHRDRPPRLRGGAARAADRGARGGVAGARPVRGCSALGGAPVSCHFGSGSGLPRGAAGRSRLGAIGPADPDEIDPIAVEQAPDEHEPRVSAGPAARATHGHGPAAAASPAPVSSIAITRQPSLARNVRRRSRRVTLAGPIPNGLRSLHATTNATPPGRTTEASAVA